MLETEKPIANRREQLLVEQMKLGIEQQLFPCATAWIQQQDQQNIICAHQPSSAISLPLNPNIMYDIASLTKVTVTLPLILIYIQKGLLQLDDHIIDYVPELSTGTHHADKSQITIRQLLTHTSGLPASRPYFLKVRGKQAYLQMIAQEPLLSKPGTATLYSDLGFMLLGWIAEQIGQDTLERLAQRDIFEPLQIETACYRPLDQGIDHLIAPTEIGNDYERQTCVNGVESSVNDINSILWRDNIIQGEVHDGNAYYGLNGISGHAGLFATIYDLRQYMNLWNSNSILSASLRTQATTCQTPCCSLSRGLGWEIYEHGTYGHTGFTGTSIWRNDQQDITVVLLTNRIYPTVREGIIPFRAQLRQQLFQI